MLVRSYCDTTPHELIEIVKKKGYVMFMVEVGDWVIHFIEIKA